MRKRTPTCCAQHRLAGVPRGDPQLFAGDKANMGDVFYDSVAPRADAAISTYQMMRQGGQG